MQSSAHASAFTAQTRLRDQSPLVRTLRRLAGNRSAQVGALIIGALLLVAIFADVIAPYEYDQQIRQPGLRRRSPPCIHLLGCDPQKPQVLMGLDSNFRDLFSRVVYGARLSLQIGFLTTGAAILIGTLLGAIAGYAGGWLDNFIMRLMDVLLAFPSLLLAIAIVSVLGPGLVNTLLAVAFVSIPVYARVVRSSVLSVKEMDYITASRALGASSARILFVRILPNALTPVIVVGTLGIATAILDAAGLSFLG